MVLRHLRLEQLLMPPHPQLPCRIQGQLTVVTLLCLNDWRLTEGLGLMEDKP